MQLQYRCAEPAKESLAIFNPEATPGKYQDDINDANAYWQSEHKRARKAANPALVNMASSLVRFIVDFKTQWESTKVPGDRERARMALLSILGVSVMLRTEWGGLKPILPQPTGPYGELGTVNDWVVDFPGSWQDFRIHTPIVIPETFVDGQQVQWYRQDELWCKQQRPVQPTDYLMGTYLPQLGYRREDLAGHETIFPYVGAR